VPEPIAAAMVRAAATAFFLVLLAPRPTSGALLRWCPPCGSGRGLVLAQDPCGCGVDSIKLTPRSELKAMSVGDLEAMKHKLGEEISALEGQLQTDIAKQDDMLGDMRDRLGKVNEVALKKKSVAADKRKEYQDGHDKAQAAMDKEEAEAQDMAREVAKERLELAKLSHQLSSGLAQAAGSCTKCQEVVLVEHAMHMAEYGPVIESGAQMSLLSRHRAKSSHEAEMDPHVKLEREVENLEEKAGALKQELSKGVLRFSADQRASMDKMDQLKRKIGRQDIDDNNAAARLADRSKRLERQQGAVARFKEGQAQNLKRMKEDVASVKTKVDNLVAAMKSCGCAR